MTEQQQAKASRSRVRRDSRFSSLFICVLVVGISVGVFLFFQNKHSQIVSVFDSSPQSVSDQNLTGNDAKPASSRPSSQGLDTQKRGAITEELSESEQENTPIFAVQEKRPGDSSGGIPTASPSPSLPDSRSPAIFAEALEQFFHHLDQQPYLAEFQLPEGSKAHFTKILQKLLDHPPAITRETDDYFTLLKNTAHFFRIIGKDNTLALKGILDREKESFEHIFSIFHSLTEHPDMLMERFSLTVAQEPLYDYACFFLNTIGGRLYLFRRDSNSRMVVSYYAIRIIDKANDGGYNRQGIDLLPFIDALIEEMENTGRRLRFKEAYLDTLYDLKEDYGNRG